MGPRDATDHGSPCNIRLRTPRPIVRVVADDPGANPSRRALSGRCLRLGGGEPGRIWPIPAVAWRSAAAGADYGAILFHLAGAGRAGRRLAGRIAEHGAGRAGAVTQHCRRSGRRDCGRGAVEMAPWRARIDRGRVCPADCHGDHDRALGLPVCRDHRCDLWRADTPALGCRSGRRRGAAPGGSV